MKKLLVASFIAVVVLAVVSCAYLKSDSGLVELSKQEALKLMDLQTRAVMAVADRDEFIGTLYLKYQVDPKTHQLNVQTGQFVPIQTKDKPNEEVPPSN